MPREDLKLIIDAERKSADERVNKIQKHYDAELEAFSRALNEIHAAHKKYKQRRDAMDWLWTAIFFTLLVLIVTVLV